MRVRGVSGAGAAALLWVLTSACTAPSAGTQTNWLSACRTEADCGADLECHCGACTRACDDADTACAGLDGAACVPASEAGPVALCDGRTTLAAGLCLLRCPEGDCPAGTACVAGVCAPLREATEVVAVDPSARHQILVGFGAGAVWLTDEIAAHPAANALYDSLFIDAGLDVLRLLNRYDDYGTSDLTSSVALVNAATVRLGAPPTLLLTSTSPPAALKANGSELCSGNPETCTLARRADGTFDYAGLADHWRAVLEAYAAAGISPDYASVQNDPEWVPPASSEGDACRFLPVEGTTTVEVDGAEIEVEYPGYFEAVAAVRDALTGLPAAPPLIGPDTGTVDDALAFASAGDLASLDGIALHLYDSDPRAVDREAWRSLAALGERTRRPIFQTEAQADGLGTALLLHEASSTLGASMYLQNDIAVSALLGVPNPTALVALSDADFALQDPYHAMRHFARETAPGWVRVDAEGDSGDVLATAWLAPDAGALTLVLVNPDATAVAVRLAFDAPPSSARVIRTVFPGVERSQDLGALPPNGVVTVPGESVVTVAALR